MQCRAIYVKECQPVCLKHPHGMTMVRTRHGTPGLVLQVIGISVEAQFLLQLVACMHVCMI